MKIRKEKEIPYIHMEVGDRLIATVDDGKKKKEMIIDTLERSIDVNKLITFDVEKGDFEEEVQEGIGGAFLNIKKKNKESEEIED